MKKIYLSSPTMHGEEQQFVREAFDRNWIAPVGFNIDNFETEIENYVNASSPEKVRALALDSGTSCLHLAYKVAGIKRGTPVFVSDSTYCATVFPITYEGGVPIFIDSERDSWNMDPAALEKAFRLHPEVKYVSAVHLFGTSAKIDEIREIRDAHGAVLIEDAAEALGSFYKGRHCGTFGEYNVISFNGNKIITSSSGGMLLTKTEAARDLAFKYATQSREPVIWFEHHDIGYNYRLSNVCAGIGRGQLIHLEEHRQAKKHIYETYKAGFADLPVTMNPIPADCDPNYWLSCILIDSGCPVKPMQVLDAMREYANAEGRPIWKPMSMQKVYEGSELVSIEDYPVGYDLFDRGLCLPSDIKMTQEDLDLIIGAVRRCF
ncbi:MAG: DegT/DnrJ/EryC1/StrS family aminotransferase [Clostridia bacterium]|nr:DegT/DnrJ/EryC1/StrS family aminotransferase [Clostridia bacterium]